MKKKVLFITDSLGLPRLVPEVVLYEQTYIAKCKKKFEDLEFVCLCLGAAEITTLYNQLFYYKAVKPDLIIVQSGIVDCAPRAFNSVELALLNSNSVIKKISKKVLKPIVPFIRKHRKTTSTDKKIFREYIKKFIKEFEGTTIYWNSIIPATKSYEIKVNGITANINAYNNILKEELGDKLIDHSDFNENMLMSDHHHLNELGHLNLLNKLVPIIQSVLS